MTLYDHETLSLYLSRGVYGTLIPPVRRDLKHSRHFHTLGDYACIRGGTHVFFFLKRHIVYGGQVVGPKDQGAFFLNGMTSPMGREQDAPLVWDESRRTRYRPCSEPGVFQIGDRGTYSQPYLILFEDSLGLKGRTIESDQLYFRLGKYPYPLPTNSIQGMSFCTMTPGEVSAVLELLTQNCKKQYPVRSEENVDLVGYPMPFRPEYGIRSVSDAYRNSLLFNEAHLEASVLSNPRLLPEFMRPGTATTLCRQVPISPFKPYQMDRADICYYSDPLIKDGTLPSKVIELKNRPAGARDIRQVTRYLDWLWLVGEEDVRQTELILYAPSFHTAALGQEYRDYVHLVSFG